MMKKKRNPATKPSIGRRLGSFLFWTALFLLFLVAADRALQHLTPENSLVAELQDCYLDLRSRLLNRQPDSIEGLLEQTPPPKKTYFYADSQGELHFVDSLQEVPLPYRNDAQPLTD